MAKQSIMAALNMQPLPAAQKSFSNWSVPAMATARKIRNSKEAFRFMASEEITEQGFCAIFLDKNDYVITHRYLMEDFSNDALVVEISVKYKAHSVYFFHLEDVNPDYYFGNPALINLAVGLQHKLPSANIILNDIISMCHTRHFSWRRHKWLKSQHN